MHTPANTASTTWLSWVLAVKGRQAPGDAGTQGYTSTANGMPLASATITAVVLPISAVAPLLTVQATSSQVQLPRRVPLDFFAQGKKPCNLVQDDEISVFFIYFLMRFHESRS